MLEHCPDNTFVSFPEQDEIVLTIDVVTRKHNGFSFLNTETISFPEDETALTFFKLVEKRYFYCPGRFFISGLKCWIHDLSRIRRRSRKLTRSASNKVMFYRDVISLICFWLVGRRHGTHRIETFTMPTYDPKYSHAFFFKYIDNVVYLIFSHSPIIYHHILNIINVFPGGGTCNSPDFELRAWLSLPTPTFSCSFLHCW